MKEIDEQVKKEILMAHDLIFKPEGYECHFNEEDVVPVLLELIRKQGLKIHELEKVVNALTEIALL